METVSHCQVRDTCGIGINIYTRLNANVYEMYHKEGIILTPPSSVSQTCTLPAYTLGGTISSGKRNYASSAATEPVRCSCNWHASSLFSKNVMATNTRTERTTSMIASRKPIDLLTMCKGSLKDNNV